jgi:hypothetical protein
MESSLTVVPSGLLPDNHSDDGKQTTAVPSPRPPPLRYGAVQWVTSKRSEDGRERVRVRGKGNVEKQVALSCPATEFFKPL